MQARLRKIAWRVRHKMEKLQRENDFCGWSSDLACMCGIASVELFEILDELKLDPVVVCGYCHVFIRCQGFYIDVTATQFGHPKVMVRREMPDEDYWDIQEESHYPEQLFDEWPIDQNPYKWADAVAELA